MNSKSTNEEELFYLIALSMVNGVGNYLSKSLFNHFGGAKSIFKERKSALKKIQGIGHLTAENIHSFNLFKEVENEINLCLKHQIDIISYFDKRFPSRLKEIDDGPLFFFSKGKANFNHDKMIAIVGTRTPTNYGKQFTESLIDALKPFNVCVVSGLASGTDTNAHKACVKNTISTIGVLGHGFSTIYPSSNRYLAKEMLVEGAIISEFRFHTPGTKENFPKRNRIVAAMCDAVIVVESGIKGGSMITADLANQYNRDVYALPGKISDIYSQGCNKLIANNQAAIIDSIPSLINHLGYEIKKKRPNKHQLSLFNNLNEDDLKIYNILKKGETGIDTLMYDSGIPSNRIALILLDLEFRGILKLLPGKRYCLNAELL